jgi:hypothetical protein
MRPMPTAQIAPKSLPSLKIKIRAGGAGAGRESSSTIHQPHQEDDTVMVHSEAATEVHSYQSDSDEVLILAGSNDDSESEPDKLRDDSHRDDTHEQPRATGTGSTKRLREYSDSEDVECKAKKLKKEEPAPKRPRGRPRKTSDVTRKDRDEKAGLAGKKAENLKEFSVVVYVEVAAPPKLHAGKTHRGDKMVPQAPQRCGPFSMFRKTKWSIFLENIAAVTGIDKENLLLPGMTWRMQGKKEQDGLPLQSRDAFKAMRGILKNKTRKESPVLLVHHPIVTAGKGGQTDVEGGHGHGEGNHPETTRWSEKVNICFRSTRMCQFTWVSSRFSSVSMIG